MDNKSYLRRGVFVDYEYTVDIEQTRSLLLPILRKARQTEPYKGHCKMEEDRLVIKGRTYTLNNLHQLPEDLNCFKVTSKQNDRCVGFFGRLNPLSNFHHAAFRVDGIDYISAEQFIQAKKAELFNDKIAYDRIMGCATSLDCKKNARQIKGFDRNSWETHTKVCCMPGICAKFQQNPDLMEVLLSKTGAKQIVECSNDSFWGTGTPINKPDCLDQTNWTSQGILGEILEEIRLNSRRSWNTPYANSQVGVPSITPTNVPDVFSMGTFELQTIASDRSYLQNVNTVSSVPELTKAQPDGSGSSAVVPALTASMVHPMKGSGTNELMVGKDNGPTTPDKLDEPVNEVDMVQDTPLTEP